MTSINPSVAPRYFLQKVIHIGSLDASQKGVRGDSYEGTGLSFSNDPEAWETIAKLGGQQWWERDMTGHDFLDGHAFLSAYSNELCEWGSNEGLISQGTAWRVEWFDDELDSRVSMLLSNEAAAIEELEFRGDEDDTIEEISTHFPTQTLRDAMGHKTRAGDADPSVLDDLATVWAERHGFAGMWWNDDLAPEKFSAPRGVIFPQFVEAAEWKCVSTPQPHRKRSVKI